MSFDLFTLPEGVSALPDGGGDLIVTVHEPHPVAWKSGAHTTTGYVYNRVVDAEWKFSDGIQVHARNTADQITYSPYGRRPDTTRRSELTKRTRVYVHSDAPFNVLEDLENRTRRPHDLYKPTALEVLARLGIEVERLTWSQRAGCSCPCSPGFILTGDAQIGLDIWITIPGAPTIDPGKPGRQLVSDV